MHRGSLTNMDKTKRQHVSKVYCEKCDSVFVSRSKFEKHFEKHSGVSNEMCPIDSFAQKLVNWFKNKK